MKNEWGRKEGKGRMKEKYERRMSGGGMVHKSRIGEKMF